MSRRASNDSTKSTSTGPGRKCRRPLKAEASGAFNWDRYLQQTRTSAAPLECFKQDTSEELVVNKFNLDDKLEAKDARNPSAVSVATVVQTQGPRICLRLDGTDGCNDFWRLVNSKDIFPLGTCKEHGGLLQPPLGFTRSVSTWPTFLQRTLRKAKPANSECFIVVPEGPGQNLFEIGMKLEAVDKKNPHLICPATIGDVDGDQVFVSFDGWRGAFDYWSKYDSRDLFPVGWCQENDHPFQAPGLKGDNASVVDKLKVVAEQRKRQTRSVKNQIENMTAAKEVLTQTKEKPIRRRRIDSIKVSSQNDKTQEEETIQDVAEKCPEGSMTSDSSASSDDSDSSQEESVEKKIKLEPVKEENALPYMEFQPTMVQSKEEPSHSQLSEQHLKKLGRRARKQKRKQKRIAKALKRVGIDEEAVVGLKDEKGGLNLTPEQIVLLTSPRKQRHSAMESDYIKSKLRKKKKKKKLIDTSYTRMEGFGLKGAEHSIAHTSTSPTSPFLDVLTAPPTSLFGGDKSQIVREATQGWPARLQIGSVVTSDNKLGRFNTNPGPQEKTQENKTEVVANSDVVASTGLCVSTTNGTEEGRATDRTTTSPFVTSTTQTVSQATKDSLNAEDTNNMVSSTTNPPHVSPLVTPSAANKSFSSPVPSQPHSSKVSSSATQAPDKRRSRNPSKWSIDDVVDYVKEKEPALHQHLGLFQKHEIDGGAFLLLNSNNIVKYMALKLGPALKLCSLVEELKNSVSKHSRHRSKK